MSIAQYNDVTSRDKLMTEVRTMIGAGVGVIAIRTREPFNVLNYLREQAWAEPKIEFKAWTMTRGWHSYDRVKSEDDPTFDGNVQPMAALAAIQGIPKQGNAPAVAGFPSNGYYAMMWPHFPMKGLPPFLQMLAQLSYELPEGKQRLLLVMPQEFDMPKELEESITIVDHDPPGLLELREAYDEINGNMGDPAKRLPFDDEGIMDILTAGVGMTLPEFESALSQAIVRHKAELGPNLDLGKMVKAISTLKTAIIKRSEVLEIMEVGPMSDVGGLENLKEWVRTRRHCFDAEAQEMGVDRPKGIALIGPPGTGKSLAAKAIGSELSLPLIRFDVSRVFAGLVGQSESRVRAALQLIDAMAPCVVLLDEIDKSFSMNEGGGDSGVGKRVLGAILTHMQESKAVVFWVMTANRTAGLPPEMLRKGRLDEVFSVTVPGDNERRDIFGIHLSKRGWKPVDVKNLDVAVSRSAGFVPAECEAAVKEAITIHYANWKDSGGTGKIGPLTGDLIAAQLGLMKPLSEAFATQFAEMHTWAVNNARPASRESDAQAAQEVAEAENTQLLLPHRNRPRARSIDTQPAG